MTKTWKALLRPVSRAIWLYLGLVLLREAVRMGGNYSMSAAFRVLDLLKGNNSGWYWFAFLGGLALYFEISIRIDGRTLWFMTTRVNTPLYTSMRTSAFARFLDLPLRWHQRHNSAVLVGEVNSGIDRVEEIVDATGWELAPLLAATLLALAPLAWLSPASTLVVALAGTVFVLFNYKIYIATEAYRVARCDWQRDDWRISTEYVRRLPAVLMANSVARARTEYARVQDGLAYNTVEECRYEVFRYGRWRDRLMSWARVALIGLWLHQLRTQTLTMVDCIYVWRVCEDLFTFMEGYCALFERFANNTESVKRFFAVLEAAPAKSAGVTRAAGCAPEMPGRVEIEFRDVRFRYQSERPCLEGVSLRIRPGETLGIIGRSGSGKSTVAKMLCGLFDIDSGDILINGGSIREAWSPEEVRSLISYVPQLNEAGLFERSLADNIRFAVPDAPIAKVMEAAEAAGLHEDIMNLPGQYETSVGESGCTLSGGQVQRVLIARELLKDAPVFVLDEAMSGQDVLTERRILRCMMPRLAGKTVILISHRLDAVRRLADRIAVIEEGIIVECGTDRELMRARGPYFRMVARSRRNGEDLPGRLRLARRRAKRRQRREPARRYHALSGRLRFRSRLCAASPPNLRNS